MKKCCIRENTMLNARYLDRQGNWNSWEKRATFNTQDAAERFATKHGITTFGLFPA